MPTSSWVGSVTCKFLFASKRVCSLTIWLFHTERDDKEAISKENIISERTRGVGKPQGQYQEPNDEDLLEDAAQKS